MVPVLWSHARAALEVTVRPSTRSNFTCQRNNNNINNHSINQPWSSSPRSVRDASTTSFLPIVGRRRLHDRPSDTKVGTQKTNKMASCRVASESRNGPRPKNRNVRDATARPMSFQSLNVQKRRNNQRKKKGKKNAAAPELLTCPSQGACWPARFDGSESSVANDADDGDVAYVGAMLGPLHVRRAKNTQTTTSQRNKKKSDRNQSTRHSPKKSTPRKTKKPIEPGDDRV